MNSAHGVPCSSCGDPQALTCKPVLQIIALGAHVRSSIAVAAVGVLAEALSSSCKAAIAIVLLRGEAEAQAFGQAGALACCGHSKMGKNFSNEEADVSTSIARGWWWPAGADQGLVAVSFPGVQGSEETDAMASAVGRSATITFRGGYDADSLSKSALWLDNA